MYMEINYKRITNKSKLAHKKMWADNKGLIIKTIRMTVQRLFPAIVSFLLSEPTSDKLVLL